MNKYQKLIKHSDKIFDIWVGFCVGWLCFGDPELFLFLLVFCIVAFLIIVITLIISYFMNRK
jgi:hypothetical protein